MTIFKGALLGLLVSVAGCANQAVVAPTAATPAAASRPPLITQTIGAPLVQVHASDVVLPSMIRMGFVGYPESARQALISGTVITLTYVGKDGVPFKCIVERQSFFENGRDNAGNLVRLEEAYSIVGKDGGIVPLADLFDPLAIKAMMDARFNPERRAGVPVVSIVRVPVAFGLVKR
jgi:hypothetical protein